MSKQHIQNLVICNILGQQHLSLTSIRLFAHHVNYYTRNTFIEQVVAPSKTGVTAGDIYSTHSEEKFQ